MNVDEIKRNQFYKFPSWLLEKQHKQLSDRAKIMYMIFWDRLKLSIKNNWYDHEGKAYIFFTVEQLQEILNCSKHSVIKTKKELSNAGLIEEKRQFDSPNRIYVSAKSALREVQKVHHVSAKSALTEVQKVHSIKTNNIKTNISRLSESEDVDETYYLDIETSPPPPKKTMDFGQFIKRSGLRVSDDHIQRFREYIGLDGMELELVKLAITKTGDQGIQAPAYAFGILENWKTQGITTLEQALKEQEEFETRKSKRQIIQSKHSTSGTPDWSDPDFKEQSLDEMWEEYENDKQ